MRGGNISTSTRSSLLSSQVDHHQTEKEMTHTHIHRQTDKKKRREELSSFSLSSSMMSFVVALVTAYNRCCCYHRRCHRRRLLGLDKSTWRFRRNENKNSMSLKSETGRVCGEEWGIFQSDITDTRELFSSSL